MKQGWRRRPPRTHEEILAFVGEWDEGMGRHMTEQPASAVMPQWDTADRMRKALRESGMSVQQIADYLGVARNTVSTWINGRIEPSAQTLRLWAMVTGVNYRWLCHGTDGHHPPSDNMHCRIDKVAA